VRGQLKANAGLRAEKESTGHRSGPDAVDTVTSAVSGNGTSLPVSSSS